ncbi:MAG TPA: cyclic nucleotide-binding domain-containing protein [Solirubrobacterales bacterium]|jgi:CRP/FNR family cyclic AMP-dependent transcriptional regulator|nr:cyclic nucleotide-binding domain-containing protein [Solirubrobacterales bacterium]
MAEIEDQLARVPLFSGIKPKELKKLSKRMTERSFNEGDEITREGESGIGFFVIEDGSATVSIGGKIVSTLGPGEHFGEVALIDSGPRSATIIAGTDLRCRGMSAWEFRPFVEEHPEVAWALLETLVGRLRAAESAG